MPPRSVLGLLAVALLVVPLAGCIGGTGGNGTGGGSAPADTTVEGDASPDVSAPTATEHVHDRWDGQEVRSVVDRTVATRATTDAEPTGPLLDTFICVFICGSYVEFAPAEGEIVPPGTEEVTFTASWDASPPAGHEFRIFADYLPADAGDYQDLAEIENGETYTINTTTEMADGGHAKQSLWKFRVFVIRCTTDEGAEICTTRLSNEELEFDVTVEAHRVDGPLPKEPAHPDWWADGTARPVGSASGQASTTGAGVYHVNASSSSIYISTTYASLNGTEHAPVPPGTARLTANVTWTNEAPTADAAGVQPFMLWYDSSGVRYRMWQPEEVGDGQARFELPIDPDQTDGMYAKERSRWLFLLGFQGSEDTGADEPFFGSDLTNPYRFEGSYELEITAHNTTSVPDGSGG